MIKAYAAFEPKGELKPFEYDPGELKPMEVEIDVHYCGICHSDLSVIDSEWGPSSYPVVAGHEVVGKISQVGSHVRDLTVGQIVGHYGGFADKVRAAANSVVPIPDGIDLESAGPLFCGGITVFNPLLQFGIKPTDKVAVIGIGGLGHMALKFLNAWGCEVTAFTSTASKKKEALSLGAHHTLNSRDENEINSAAGWFDYILSTVNVKLDWNLYLGTLAPRGRLHFVGATLAPLDIGVFSLIGAQRSVSGSPVGSPATIAKMLDFAKLHQIRPEIEKFKFTDINKAIARLRSGEAHYRVVLCR